jgi:hypothetical protein
VAEETKEELLNLIDQMADIDKKSREVGRKLGEIREETRLIRARLLVNVTQEKDERGKPIYSNDKLREAAVTVRLAEHDEYQALHEKEKVLRYEHDDLLIELRRLSARKELLTADQDRGLFSLLLGLGRQ